MDEKTLQALVALNDYERKLDKMQKGLDRMREEAADSNWTQLELDRFQTRLNLSRKRTQEMRGIVMGNN